MEISCSVTDFRWDGPVLYITLCAAPIPFDELPQRYHKKADEERYDQQEEPKELQFGLRKKGQLIPLQTFAGPKSGTYTVRLNVTNISSRKEVPNGAWKIVPCWNHRTSIPVDFDPARDQELSECSRTFLFDENRQAYVVNFDLSEDDQRPELVMRVFHYQNKVKWRTIPGGFKRRLRVWLMRGGALAGFLQLWYAIWHNLSRPPGNRVLFAAQQRKDVAGNLRCVRDRMVERGLDQQYDLREWTDPNKAKFARLLRSWLRLSKAMASSDYVFVDDYCRLLDYITLSRDTVLTQLWHAGYGFKAVGFARFGRYGSPRLDCGHRQYTYAICGSTHLRTIYSEVFGIEEDAILPTGLPRIDGFLDQNHAEQVRSDFSRDYPELQGKRILLFAPTYRGRGSYTAHYDYRQLDLEKLYELCGDQAVVLFRMHPFIKKKPPIPKGFSDRLIDFSRYPETNDLLYLSDVLITDYSSIVYEYSLLDRPMLFFAYDEAAYQAARGFHGDYREIVPGKVCNTFSELLTALRDGDFEHERVARYRARYFDHTDTGSTDRVIDQIVLRGKSPVIPSTDS